MVAAVGFLFWRFIRTPGLKATSYVWGFWWPVLASFSRLDGLFSQQRPPFDPGYCPPIYGGGDAAGGARVRPRRHVSGGADSEAGGVGNASEAEDLTQEAFMRLYRKIVTFRAESAFSTWLHRLTCNIVLMR